MNGEHSQEANLSSDETSVRERAVTFSSLDQDASIVKASGSINSCNDSWAQSTTDSGYLIKPDCSSTNLSDKDKENGLHSVLHSFISSILSSAKRLHKSVGFSHGFSLMVGMIIGSGIFLSPSLVALSVKDVGVSLVIWCVCGTIALLGALCYCELGTAIPKAGGNYAFILYIYGPVAGFLCSWTQALIIDPTGVAAICLTIGTYVIKPFDEIIQANKWYPKAIALACIMLIGLTNCLSIKVTKYLQGVFTACQTLSIIFIAVLGLWKISTGHVDNFRNIFENAHMDWHNLGIYGSAFFGALWAYNGWQYISNVTEEMVNVKRDLFRTVVTAVPFVTISYLFVNVAFFTLLTETEVGNSRSVAADFVAKVFGKKVSYIIPPLVAISCYGSANGLVFACGRISLAAGRAGHMPEILGMIHAERRTPIPAVLLTMFVSTLMLLPDGSNLQNLINFASIATWILCLIVISGIIVLRIREPDLHRPFKVWIIVPIFMTFIAINLVIIPFTARPINSAIAISIILLGLPVYYVFVYSAYRHPEFVISFRERITKVLKQKLNLVTCS